MKARAESAGRLLKQEVHMKGLCVSLIALVAAAAAVLHPSVALSEQTPSQAPAAQSSTGEVPFILVELSGSLNAKKLKPGDTVKAQVAQDVLAHGKVIIPAESKLVGHVTEAKPKGENEESRLGLVFDKILLKHHQELSIRGVIQTVAPPVVKRSRVDEPDPMAAPPAISPQNSPMTPMGSSKTTNQTPSSSNAPRSSGTGTLPVPGVQIAAGGGLPGSPGYRPQSADGSAQNQSLSVGMRPGVFGLKGLSLSTETGGPTPGPVIVSKVVDVKLEGGTQVLLRILDSGSANRPPSP
jgi:hypothetical protein